MAEVIKSFRMKENDTYLSYRVYAGDDAMLNGTSKHDAILFLSGMNEINISTLRWKELWWFHQWPV